MKSISNLIRSADIFSKSINFKYGKKDGYETFIGGSISLLLLGLLIFSLYSLSYDRRYHFNPNLSVLPGYNTNNEFNVKNTSANIIMIPYVDFSRNNRSYTYESSSVQIVAEKGKYVNLQNGTQLRTWERVAMKPCDINDFDEEVQKVFYSAKLNYGLCLTDRNIPIKGAFESEVFQFLKVNIMECNYYNKVYNETRQVCKPENDTISMLDKIKFTMFLSYSQLDADNFNKPNYSILYNEQILLLSTTNKRVNIFFSPNTVSTDNDLFFNYITKNDTYAGLYNVDEDIASIKIGELSFYTLFLRASPRYEVILRSYKKVPTILAEAGSLISYLNFILIYVIGYYNDKMFELSLINHLSSFDDNFKKREKSSKEKGVKHKIEMKGLEELPKTDKTDSNINQTLPYYKKIVMKKSKIDRSLSSANKSTIRFSFLKFLFSGCKNKTKENEMMQRMSNMIEGFLDIKNFMIMNQEFSYLKDSLNSSHKNDNKTHQDLINRNTLGEYSTPDYSISNQTYVDIFKNSKNK